MIESVKKAIADDKNIMWAIAFVGVCVLVGLGKIKPETIEYLLFALLGARSTRKKEEEKK